MCPLNFRSGLFGATSARKPEVHCQESNAVGTETKRKGGSDAGSESAQKSGPLAHCDVQVELLYPRAVNNHHGVLRGWRLELPHKA